jgi:hypothetical protein
MIRVAVKEDDAVTRRLLTCGAIAGPIYVGVGTAEILGREGFDMRRHALSLMANGEWGWIHIAMMVATGLLTVAGAVGVKRALAGGRGATWAPLLLGVYGLGLVGAGFFTADPGLGFPPGTPEEATAISGHGLMHFVMGGIGFLGLIAACLVFARRFELQGERGWAAFSVTTGVLFLAAFVGIASGSQGSPTMRVFVTLAFTAAVVLAWAWITLVALRLRS